MVTKAKPASDESLKTEGWRQNLDLDAFKKEIDALGQQFRKSKGPEDRAHLDKILTWQRLALLAGLATAWTCVNPVSVVLLSTAVFIRWTMVGHHVCHGGYDQLKDARFHRSRFALGARRLLDWIDWMLPEAWNQEHNQLHHYRLNEPDGDPDLVESHMEELRRKDVPMATKYATIAFFMLTWKWFYYAPNTLKTLKALHVRQSGKDVPEALQPRGLTTILSSHHAGILGDLLVRVLLPFFLYQFVVLPMPFLLLGGWWAFRNAVANLVLAELLTNVHAFATIVTNHCGEDLYRFSTSCQPRSGEFYLRQVIGSTNYRTGGDFNDMLHGWLNYQIEHHLFPDLSMLQYQRIQPLVKAICERHGVPYVQESVFTRLRKTIDIMVGNTSMKRF